MAIIHFTCPVCSKRTAEKSRREFAGVIAHTLECGHIYVDHKSMQAQTIEIDRLKDLASASGKKLYDFQIETVKFLENPACNFRGLIGHEQGLGKTVCVAAALRFHPELFPVLVICKSSLMTQWERMVEDFAEDVMAQIIRTGKDSLIPPRMGINCYIISYDLLSAHWQGLSQFGIKLIVLDECQLIKNTETNRTRMVREISKSGMNGSPVPHVLALSGTSIKNNAVEYFPVLNLLHPEQFPQEKRYIRDYVSYYVDSYGKSRYGGLNKYSEPRFRRVTNDWIIRKTRDEVSVQLPTINRTTAFFEIDDLLRDEYRRVMADLQKYIDDNNISEDNISKHVTSLLGYMAKLRRVVGNAKVYPTIEWITEYRNNYPDDKICVFVHHHEVGDRLERLLSEMGENFIRVSDKDSAQDKELKLKTFVESKSNEILIARTLAEGEGLNLQVCRQVIILEREFNPANEEQAESRFCRIGAQHSQINVLYPTAVNSIDEWLAELVERKRDAMKNTLDGVSGTYKDSTIAAELLNMIQNRGGKRWQI